MVKILNAENLKVKIYETGELLGKSAAEEVILRIKELLKQKRHVNMLFAAAPSQNEFLFHLTRKRELEWERINAFHMDEYLELPEKDERRFGNFLKSTLFDHIPFASVNYIDGNAVDPGDECRRYGLLLKENPLDIACMGIGENGHLAFNDPPVADFSDPYDVKVVRLDERCRQQQVNDGCFKNIDEVPGKAITLTIPSLMRAGFIYCVVPGERKSEAVFNTIHAPISEQTPSTILRTHSHAVLYIDSGSAGKLNRAD
ncbi:MAG: glucosamine-6-phosphate deaminase [Sphingobacteriales bacterium UTBCD1]|jgi:glucosamine-6-phosphate deaminase|nr:MAG: glucosamine-6-phosphate deaminase [Sphingobacteriales bacterium UTBCD1]